MKKARTPNIVITKGQVPQMPDPNAPNEDVPEAPASIEAEVFDQALAGTADKDGIHQGTIDALRSLLTEGTQATANQFLEAFTAAEFEDADR
ncbi:MAG: hypothetical protein VX528_03365 [Candidatus Latescibacterota bacterium]|nr:hypothetical protein [Candidatus Latescibacterota bacterium]